MKMNDGGWAGHGSALSAASPDLPGTVNTVLFPIGSALQLLYGMLCINIPHHHRALMPNMLNTRVVKGYSRNFTVIGEGFKDLC